MSSMNIKIICLSFLVIALLSGVAISEVGEWQNFTYSNDATAAAAGPSTIWCATSGGLIEYDITNGQTTKYLNSDGIGSIDLLSVTVDTSGSVFAGGTNGTLTKITSSGQVIVYDFEYISEIRYNIWDLYVDGEILWVATDIGIGKFLIYRNGGEFRDVIPQLGEFTRESVVNTLIPFGGYLWAGTDEGLANIEKDNDNPQNPLFWNNIAEGENGLSNGEVSALAIMGDTLFAGTADGVFQMGTDSLWQNIGLSGMRIYDLENISGSLTAATNSGVYIRNGAVWSGLSGDSLIVDDARSVCVDSLGNTWAAYEDGGFGQYMSSYWDIITLDGPASNYISDIAVDSSGHVWLTHSVGGFASPEGVSRYDGTQWTNYTPENSGLEGSGAFAVEYDYRNDEVWFGSWGDGLKSFDRDSVWTTYDETNSPLAGVTPQAPDYIPISDLAMDDDGNLWILEIVADNPAVTLAIFNPADSIWQAYYERPDQIPDHFQRVLHLRGNEGFVGGTNVYRLSWATSPLDTADVTWSEQLVNTSGGEVYALNIDRNDKLLIGGAWGLAFYNLDYIDFPTNDTVNVDLPDGYRTAVYSIAQDGLGYSWVGTDSGIVILNIPLNQFRANIIDTFSISNSDLISNTIKHIEVDRRTGLVYIGTDKGLSIYSSGNVSSENLNQLIAWPNPVNIRQGDDMITFQGVPAEADIYIYNAAGELIISGPFADRTWDLKTKNGNLIAAGVYFFYARSGNNSGTGKFAVIR